MEKFNSYLDKIMWALPLLSVAVGIILGDRISRYAFLGIYSFAIMTFTGSVSMNYKDFFNVIKKPSPIFLFLFITHVVMLIISFFLAKLFFDKINTTIGFILLFSGPVGVVSFMWTSVYKGNSPLSLTIILLDSLLSPLLVPLALYIFCGEVIKVPFSLLGKSLLFMVVIPLFLGIFLNGITKGESGRKLGGPLKPVGKLLLIITVVLNVSRVSEALTSSFAKNAGLFLFCEIMVLSSFLLAFFLCKVLHYSRENRTTISISSGMRNTAAVLVLSASYFEPSATIPIIAVIVFQQLNCGIVGKILFKNPPESLEQCDSSEQTAQVERSPE